MSNNSNNTNKQQYFVTGIDTDAGKTIVSSILVQALGANYWKPVQSGDLHHTDTMKVQALVSNTDTVFYPETYRLQTPASPHYAAEIDGIYIDLAKFALPNTNKPLIVEGAGGIMVPLNKQHLILDLMKRLQLPVILVSKNYLGSINHTLLSIETLKKHQLPIAGVIFNGQPTPSTETIIQHFGNIPVLANVPLLPVVNAETIANAASNINPENW